MKEYIGQQVTLDLGQIGPSTVTVEDVRDGKVIVRYHTGKKVDFSIGSFKILAGIDIKRRID